MKKFAGKMKRALAILLAAVMAASVLPVGGTMPGATAYAAESESAPSGETEEGSGEDGIIELEEGISETPEQETSESGTTLEDKNTEEDSKDEISTEEKSTEEKSTEEKSTTEISTEETGGMDGTHEASTENVSETEEISETASDAELLGVSSSEIFWETIEIEGVYQFGGAPSKDDTDDYYDPSAFSLETSGETRGISIEDYIYQQLQKKSAEINISGYQISKDRIGAIFSGVINEHPELYFVSNGFRYSYYNTVIAIQPSYISGKFDDALFKSRAAAALAAAASYTTELQKAIALHDYLAVNCEYDYDNYRKGTIPKTSYTAYGALANRMAVCQGYALAYKYLLNKLGIECLMVTSDSMNHAWNLIKLDGQYYQVDVTWADPTWDMLGRVSHQYMFKSDNAFKNIGASQEDRHRDWVVTSGGNVVNYRATDTRYDSAFWDSVTSPLVLVGNDCYYAASGSIYKTSLSNVANAGSIICYIGRWGNWLNTFTGLFQYDNRLYYNDTAKIYSIKFDGSDKKTVYTPNTGAGTGYVYGSALRDGNLWYVLHTSPNLEAKETPKDSGVKISEVITNISVQSIALDKNTLELTVGSNDTLTATVTPSYTIDTITWASSNNAVATVTGGQLTGGQVTATVQAVAAGTCTITVKAGAKSAVCMVTVKKRLEGITLVTASGKTMLESDGDSDTLYVSLLPADAYTRGLEIEWVSSAPNIAGVNGNVDVSGSITGTVTTKAYSAAAYGNKERADVTITAKVKGTDMQASLTYTVIKKDDTKPVPKNHTVYVLTNRDKKLGDEAITGQLPDGWTWTGADNGILISSFAGVTEKEFSVVHTNAVTGEEIYDKVNVCFSTIGGMELKDTAGNAVSKLVFFKDYVSPDGSKTPVPDPNVTSATISTIISGVEMKDNNRLKDCKYSVEFAPKAKTDVVTWGDTLDAGTGSIRLTANKAGSTTLLVQLKYKDGTVYYEKKFTITVEDVGLKGIADIKLEFHKIKGEGETEGQKINADTDDSYGISINLKDGKPQQAAYIKNNTVGSFKFTYSSSDTSVLKIGSATNAAPDEIPLTPLKAGTALLTVKADDVPKTAKTYIIRVTNAIANTADKAELAKTISLSRTSATVNTALATSDTLVAVYNGFGGTIADGADSVKMEAAPKSKLAGIMADVIKENSKNTNEILLSVKSGQTPVSGKGKLTVKLKADGMAGTIDKTFDITVTVKNTAPAITIAQLDKLNIFYNDKPGHFSVGSPDGEIADVTLTPVTSPVSNAPMAKNADYSFANGVLTINKVPTGTKKLNFAVKVDGYTSPVEKKNVALSTETADFKLSATSGTVYTDSESKSTSLRLIDKATGLPVDLSRVTLAIQKYDYGTKKYVNDTNYTLAKAGEKLTLTAAANPDTRGDKLKLTFASDGWNGSKTFDFTVKGTTLKYAALSLGKTSLTLYNYKGKNASTETTLALKGGSEGQLNNIDITEAVARNAMPSLGRTLNVAYADGIVKASKLGEALKAGTYRFKISLPVSGKTLSTTLSVRVIDVDMNNTRTQAKATASARGTIDVLNRQGTSIVLTPKFTNVPTDAEVTEIELAGADKGLFKIVRRTGNQVTVALKDNVTVATKYPYKLQAVYTIKAGDTELALTSNVLSVKLTQKNPKVKISGENVFSSTRGDTRQISFALTNSVGASIEAAEIVMVSAPKDFAYDSGNLSYAPRGATASNKSYTLKFTVYPAGRGLNEKPLTVSYKVTIAK